MRECVRAQTRYCPTLLFALRDLAFLPSRKFRGSLLRGVPRWLLLPLKDAFSWFRRDIFPQREGNVRYKRAGVEYEMRATDLFKGAGQTSGLSNYALRVPVVDWQIQTETDDGTNVRARSSDVEQERVARRPVNRLSLHRHESRGGPYWPLKKRRFSL